MDDKTGFQALLDKWAAAIVANDADSIGSFATSDWILTGPEGGPGDRETFLSLVASGDLTHSEMEFELLEVRVFGEVAVILAHGTNKGAWRGEPFSSDEWVTEVFVREDGAWLCTMSALTPNYAARAA
ncbi:nuclear transport factor 2 family protein [Nocardia amamiensis]|uniref:nuclear transport factor 2 family protein n=1 Tax=Nocardia amamiensis TaxID=404578 RepID=UPI00083501FC|nr:nuclear transport factor 2 family protein [Nocardia amamiensis]